MIRKILITGGGGLVGMNLSSELAESGIEVIHLSRNPKSDAKFKTYKWSIDDGFIDSDAFIDLDCIIHLAGAGVADKRWTEARKRVIIDSRVESAKLLFNKVKEFGTPLKSFLSASAVGYYGDRKDELLDESSSLGPGFLSEVCNVWEQAAKRFESLNIPVSIIRIGLVLSTEGGVLSKMIPSFKLGIATYFGSGEQYFPWIHINDLSRIFKYVLQNEAATGIYNGVAPNPVTGVAFAKSLKSVIGNPSLLVSTPAALLKLGAGERAAALLMSSRVSSKKIEEAGFEFNFQELHVALKDVIERKV